MEADWEVEIGGDAPVIEAHWPGFLDLQVFPCRAETLPETIQQPGLAAALIQLNQPQSPVWTAKCDIWEIADPESLDPYELHYELDCGIDATNQTPNHGRGCYIDLLPKSGHHDQQWLVQTVQTVQTVPGVPDTAAHWCNDLCNQLHLLPLRSCRVDLMIRKAWLTPETEALGVTAYFTAAGPSQTRSSQTLQSALTAFADALIPPKR